MKRFWSILPVFFALCATPARAHDFWIEPSTYRPDTGSALSVRLRVGEPFRGVPYPRTPGHLRTFVLAGPSGTKPITGRPGDEPAGRVQVDAPGCLVVGYTSNPTMHGMPGDAFGAYLREEGQAHLLNRQAAYGPVRESYSRCAKAILCAGAAPGAGYDRRLGLALEFVPERNPYALGPGDTLPLRVLYGEKPLAGLRVVALNADHPERAVEARSDAAGRVRVHLDREGVWMIRGVYVLPASGGEDTRWESFWASLTFEVRDVHSEGKKSSRRIP